MKLARHFGFYSVYQVTFPSPLQTDITENNTVTCEYYQCTGDDARPAVILLDIMDGSMIVPRLIANSLVSNRVNAAIMYMPHYGPRKSQDKNKLRSMTEDPQVLIQAVEQAVMDIRRTARWLTGQKNIDANRIGLCGTSLGGFVAALTVGVDARFSKAAIIMAGGDLASVLMTDAGEVRSIKQHLQKMQIDRDTLQAMLAPIEPLTFADRLRQTNLLMVNGSLDTIVPPDCAKQLAQRTNTEIQWYPADHYDMVKHLFQILNHINQHFNPNTWPTQP
jgi:dienelactone hydrolase